MEKFYFAQTMGPKGVKTYRINVGEATATEIKGHSTGQTVSVDEIEAHIEYVYSVEAETLEEALNPNSLTQKVWTGKQAAATARQVANRRW